jgi:DnaK suppressor protein
MTSPSTLIQDEYLNDEQVLFLKSELDQQLRQLLELGRRRVREVSEAHQPEVDTLDFAVSETNRTAMLKMADRERRLLRKVRKAMLRLQEGDYGSCESCGAEIGYNRLMVRPMAALCIDCQTQVEHSEGRRVF